MDSFVGNTTILWDCLFPPGKVLVLLFLFSFSFWGTKKAACFFFFLGGEERNYRRESDVKEGTKLSARCILRAVPQGSCERSVVLSVERPAWIAHMTLAAFEGVMKRNAG